MSPAAETLAKRVDDLADAREQRPVPRTGYYTPAIRFKAKAIAVSMLASAESHGINLGLLDVVGDLASIALDAASASAKRRS